MKYLFIGFMLSIGWYLAKILLSTAEEIIEKCVQKYKETKCRGKETNKHKNTLYKDTTIGFTAKRVGS